MWCKSVEATIIQISFEKNGTCRRLGSQKLDIFFKRHNKVGGIMHTLIQLIKTMTCKWLPSNDRWFATIHGVCPLPRLSGHICEKNKQFNECKIIWYLQSFISHKSYDIALKPRLYTEQQNIMFKKKIIRGIWLIKIKITNSTGSKPR